MGYFFLSGIVPISKKLSGIKELRLLGRSIFVLDRNGAIQYIQNVKELSEEPNYDAVIEATQKIV